MCLNTDKTFFFFYFEGGHFLDDVDISVWSLNVEWPFGLGLRVRV